MVIISLIVLLIFLASFNHILDKKNKVSLKNIRKRKPYKKRYLKLSRYSQLLNYMDPLYEWEKENYPFLYQFPAFRFVCKEKSVKINDYQSIYINSKENLIYTFNLINQSYSLSLEAFMIDDIKEFYICLEIQEEKEKKAKNFIKKSFQIDRSKDKSEIKDYLKKLEERDYLLIKCIKLIFSFYNEDYKPLEAYLYPPNSEKIPYLVFRNDINYKLILDNAFSIISLLELLKGGFFLNQGQTISLDGVLRVKLIN